jgi:hypothetical protein
VYSVFGAGKGGRDLSLIVELICVTSGLFSLVLAAQTKPVFVALSTVFESVHRYHSYR